MKNVYCVCATVYAVVQSLGRPHAMRSHISLLISLSVQYSKLKLSGTKLNLSRSQWPCYATGDLGPMRGKLFVSLQASC